MTGFYTNKKVKYQEKERRKMLEKISQIIEEKLGLDGVSITAETRFKED